MTRRAGLAGVTLALASLGSLPLHAAEGAAGASRAPAACAAAPAGFSQALARAMPYAVGIYTVQAPSRGIAALKPDDEPMEDDPEAVAGGNVGAGVVLQADGTIATAAHVVRGAQQVIVRLADDRIVPASVVGIDTDTDIALLRVAVRWPAEPPLGHSVSLRPGDWVIAVGEPFALGRTAVAGIVGGPARHFTEDRDSVFIQSDIGLSPGHSGGPLLDAGGAIVGVNARAISGPYGLAGMSLTVPIEVVLRVAKRLRTGVREALPRFGASFADLLPPQAFLAGLSRASGAVVQAIDPEGIAAGAGLRRGDIVVGLNGVPVGDSADLARLLLEREAAGAMRFTVYRGGAYRELRLP